MVEIKGVDSKHINVQVVTRKSHTTLRRGSVKGYIKEPKKLIMAILLGVSFSLTVGGVRSIDKTLKDMDKRVAIERYEESPEIIDNKILSLFIREALEDMETEKKYAEVYGEIKELYDEAEKATRISDEADQDHFDLYLTAKERATSDYIKAVDLLNANDHIFGYGPYVLFNEAEVGPQGNVLFEVTDLGTYGSIKASDIEGQGYSYYSVSIRGKRKFVDAEEHLAKMKEASLGKK